jgi:hypothetical protein
MWHRSVLPNYHATMGIPLVEGRLLSAADEPGAPDVLVVSRSFAEQSGPASRLSGNGSTTPAPSGRGPSSALSAT